MVGRGPTDDGQDTASDARRVGRRGFLAAAVAGGLSIGVLGSRPGDDGTDGAAAESVGQGHPPSAPTRAASVDADPRGPSDDTTVIGANLNGRPHRLLGNLDLLDASETTWVRAFLDVRAKLAADADPRTDPDVRALRRAARERNCKLVVNLKWDFAANWGDKAPMRVPRPGSAAERALCTGASDLLAGIGAPVDVVVLGNEPMWETLDADVRVEDPPILRFTRTLKDHLVASGDHGDPTYLVGALNRIHDERLRRQHYSHFYRGLTAMAREDDDVDGVDLHVHFDRPSEAEATLAVAREAVPEGTIFATEFSPVFRYARHVRKPIDASPAGERFRREHGLPNGMTAIEYFERAKQTPRPASELADFYAAMPWYDVDHVADMHARFAAHGVGVATFGFMQSWGMRDEDWTTDWEPFHINFLYQHALVDADGGIEETANRHYLADYRRLAGGDPA